MKKNFYLFFLFTTLFLLGGSAANAQCSAPSGTAGVTPATYSFSIVDVGTAHTFTLIPDDASTGASLYINNAFIGAGATTANGGYTWNPTLTDGTVVTFYFLFTVGGQQQSQTYTYTVGSCTAATPGAPTVSISSPANNTNFVTPVNITVTADATAATGSNITQVEFFANNGTTNTSIGTSTTAPYTFNWSNVPAGSYIITAVATDNNNRTTTSAPINITVTNPAPSGFCGTGATDPSGAADYEWRAETIGDSVKITFRPIGRAAGSDFVIWNTSTGGYILDMQPNGEHTRTIYFGAITNMSFYFTYRLGPGGMETNNSTTPHTYLKGSDCVSGSMPVVLENYNVKQVSSRQVDVTWATLSESNSEYFRIEAGNSANSLVEIGRTKAKGNSNDRVFYSFNDYQYKGEKKYYRLSQVDKDGRTTQYSVKVVNEIKSTKDQVYPNPLKGNTFYIRLAALPVSKVKVEILSIAGKSVFNKSISAEGNLLKVDMPVTLLAGIYTIKVEDQFYKLLVQ